MDAKTKERPYEIINLSGQTFGRLTAIKVVGRKHKEAVWLCQCQCGKTVQVVGSALRLGQSRSCGCLKLEEFSARTTTHGKSKTRLYNTYQAMKRRCYNPNVKRYEHYGGRGITICDEWLNDFQAFYDWAMANGYNPDAPRGECTIDRIDNDKGYSPANCRWVGTKAQERNKSNNHVVEFQGETHSITEWSEKTGIGVSTIIFRLKSGWSVERALTVAPIKKKSRQCKEIAI